MGAAVDIGAFSGEAVTGSPQKMRQDEKAASTRFDFKTPGESRGFLLLGI